MARKRVTVLGATGSIGDSTLDVLLETPGCNDLYEISALTANSNARKLAEAAIKSKSEFAAIANPAAYADLKEALGGSGIKCGAGETAILEAAERDSDIVVSAITGAAALKPTLAAIKRGATIALANKESLVCAGPMMIDAAKQFGAKILPVDSEHSAMFQVFEQRERVEKLVLTASGGPFRLASREQMAIATPEQAIAHPNWSMGAKISVDSATMMNKALELVEASYLFDMSETEIDVLVHPQSIIHSLVTYDDGSVLAQLGAPDMRTPISYALAWPSRQSVPAVDRLDLAAVAKLEFYKPDHDRFPALELARQTLRSGHWAPNVMNAANEIAVEAFLERQIGFLDISKLVCKVVEEFAAGRHGHSLALDSFEDVFELDHHARMAMRSRIKSLAA